MAHPSGAKSRNSPPKNPGGMGRGERRGAVGARGSGSGSGSAWTRRKPPRTGRDTMSAKMGFG